MMEVSTIHSRILSTRSHRRAVKGEYDRMIGGDRIQYSEFSQCLAVVVEISQRHVFPGTNRLKT